VPRYQLYHVVEKTDAGAHLSPAMAFNRQRESNVCFVRLAVNFRPPHTFTSAAPSFSYTNTSRDTDSSRSVCAIVPRVMRTALTSRISRAFSPQDPTLSHSRYEFAVTLADLQEYEVRLARPPSDPRLRQCLLQERSPRFHLRDIIRQKLSFRQRFRKRGQPEPIYTVQR
jgi:hypothetical protein